MLEIDKPLLLMIMGSLAEIRLWVEACGGSWFTLDDLNWDSPAAIPESPLVDPALLLKASHAIGFICGVAAGLDVTPLSLLWAIGVDTESPICAVDAKSAPTPRKLAAPVSDRRRRARAVSPTRKVKP